MIHLMFLVASLGLVVAGQKLSLLALLRIQNRSMRRVLQMLALAMPLTTLILFALTMLPAVVVPETAHHANASAHQDWLIAIIGFSLVCLPVGFALGFNLVRLIWLYLHIRRNSWPAPQELQKLASLNFQPAKTAAVNPQPRAVFARSAASFIKCLIPKSSSNSISKTRVQVRLWHSSRPFAFNLPGLWPGPAGRATIVLSTGLIAKLDHEELQAVVWHEMAHLARHDFWVVWLANWWRNSFFYLPLGRQFLGFIHSEQELACDDQVVDHGGVKSALALAAALLEVWEEMTSRVNPGSPGKGRGRGSGWKASKEILEPCFTNYFQPPGFALKSKLTVNLTEQRVNRLIELGEAPQLVWKSPVSVESKLKAGGLLGGSIGMWLMVLLTVHLAMLPLGCAISVHVM